MTLLHERYELLRHLGSGGAGQTWVALDRRTGEKVAVKELRADLTGSTRAVMEREARVLDQLDHPQIPRFVDVFVEEVRLVRRMHLVLGFVEGTPLSEELKTTRLNQAEALSTLADLLGIVAWLHQLAPPVVHRDIKPSNLIRRLDGSIALIDFGLAIDAVDRTFMHTMAAGTLGYQAPEQIMGDPSPASDVYSVGVVALELLTQATPRELLSGQTLRWEGRAAHLPGALRHWLRRALAPAVQDRFRDARVALDALPRDPDEANAPQWVAPLRATRPLPRVPFRIASRSLAAAGLLGGVAAGIVGAGVLPLTAGPGAGALAGVGLTFSVLALGAGATLGRFRQIGSQEVLILTRMGRPLPVQQGGTRFVIPFVDHEAWLPMDCGSLEARIGPMYTSDNHRVSLTLTASVWLRDEPGALEAAAAQFLGRLYEVRPTAEGILRITLRQVLVERPAAGLEGATSELAQALRARSEERLRRLGLQVHDLQLRRIRMREPLLSWADLPERAPGPPPEVPEMIPKWWVQGLDGHLQGPLAEVVVEELFYAGQLGPDSPVWPGEPHQSRIPDEALPLRRWRPWLLGEAPDLPDDSLEALREAAALETLGNWDRIMQICEELGDPARVREQVLPQIGPALSRWSDATRIMPFSALMSLAESPQACPALELVRTVSLHRLPFQTDRSAEFLLSIHARNRIRVLDLTKPIAREALGVERFVQLVEAPQFSAVEVLRAPDCDLDPTALRALSRAPFVHRLQELSLARNRIGGGFSPLVRRDIRHLRILNLGLTGLEPLDLMALAETPSRLVELNLHGNPALSETALTRFGASSPCSTLRRLTVGGSDAPLDGLFEALSAQGIPLEALTVRGGQVQVAALLALLGEQTRALQVSGVRGLEALPELLARAPKRGGLRRLGLSEVDEGGVEALASAGLEHLDELTLEGGALTGAGLRALLTGLPRLRALSLQGTRLIEEGARGLGEGGPLARHLDRLAISRAEVGPEFLGALNASGLRLSSLSLFNCGLKGETVAPLLSGELFDPEGTENKLDLSSNALGDQGVEELLRSPLIRRLDFLYLRTCDLTDMTARRIGALRTPLRLKWLDLSEDEISAAGDHALAGSPALSLAVRSAARYRAKR